MKGHFLSPYPTELALYCFRSYLKGNGRPTADDDGRQPIEMSE